MSQSELYQKLNNYLLTSIKTLLMAKALVSKEPDYKSFIDCYDGLINKYLPAVEERRESFPFYKSTFVESADHLLSSIGTSEFCRSFDVFVNVYCEELTSLAKNKKENGFVSAANYLKNLQPKLAKINFPVCKEKGNISADKILDGYREFRNHQAHIRNLQNNIVFYYLSESLTPSGLSLDLEPDNAWFLGFEESIGAILVIYKIAEGLEKANLTKVSSRST
jgi:hypothetical protein